MTTPTKGPEQPPARRGLRPETPEQTTARLAPILAQLEAMGDGHGGSTFLDLCQLVLMYSEQVAGTIKWNHPRVLVHIKQRKAARAPAVGAAP